MLSTKEKNRLYKNYGRYALVTGATSGIGKELAYLLGSAGFGLLIVSRNEKQLIKVSDHLRDSYHINVSYLAADLSTKEGMFELIQFSEAFDIGLFIANAGFGTSGLFNESHLSDELSMLSLNCESILVLTHHFSKVFTTRGRGGIVLMSSLVSFQGTPHAAHYAATKAYVQSLGEALYHELKDLKVDVLTAAPGPVNSGFEERANIKMGKALRPSDVGVPILKALGRSSTVLPGLLTKALVYSLRTVPRWAKVLIMKKVMLGMTKHQLQLNTTS